MFVDMQLSDVTMVAAGAQAAFVAALVATAAVLPRQRRAVAAFAKSVLRGAAITVADLVPLSAYVAMFTISCFPSVLNGVEAWNAPPAVLRVLQALRSRLVSVPAMLVLGYNAVCVDQALGGPLITGIHLFASLIRIRMRESWRGIRTVAPMVFPLLRFPFLYGPLLAVPPPPRARSRPARTVLGVMKVALVAAMERMLWRRGWSGPMKLVGITLVRLLGPVSIMMTVAGATQVSVCPLVRRSQRGDALTRHAHVMVVGFLCAQRRAEVPTWQRVAWGCASGALFASLFAFEVWLRR